ncbi:MAG TPA: hypothetical protein DEP05_04420 [Betaproteobacteria bacterium]|nr:hypothetical protein [Betaproteobacteria bacterium]
MTQSLRVATYNIHKGFSQFNLRVALHALREQLHLMHPDVVFLQEVLGTHRRHAARFSDWPAVSQYEFLAGEVWRDFAYGKNAVYPAGHHGNAILSRFPIVRWENEDISAHRFEQRGILHCEIDIPGWERPLHCINVHLGLFAGGRRKQILAIRGRMDRMVPEGAPLIIAGDFNDWRSEACQLLTQGLGPDFKEVFGQAHGMPARSFPSHLPLFRLDRIYIRGFEVAAAAVHHGLPWSKISDHAFLSATLTRQ